MDKLDFVERSSSDISTMPRRSRSRSSRSTRSTSLDDQFVESLIRNENGLCDATLKLEEGVLFPVCRIFLIRSSEFFKQAYLSNGKGPLRDNDSVHVPTNPEIFELALRFLYSLRSSFVTSVQEIEVGTVESSVLQAVCRKITQLLHIAKFLECAELFKICRKAMLELTRKFPRIACTALETMDTVGRQINNRNDAAFTKIRSGLLKTISNNREEALLNCSEQDDVNCEDKRILELSAESLRSVVNAIANDDVEFCFKAIFFWATHGRALCNGTKELLKNPENGMLPRAHEAKEIIKTLRLEDLDPSFVSSFIHDTDMVDLHSMLLLSQSSLKRALDDAAKIREKLRTTKARLNRVQSQNGQGSS